MKDSTLGFGLSGIIIAVMIIKYHITGNPFFQSPHLDVTDFSKLIILFILFLAVIGLLYKNIRKNET